MVLSDLTSGRSPKSMDPETSLFFYECLLKLAKHVKNQNNEKEKIFLDTLNLNKGNTTKTYGRKVISTKLFKNICEVLEQKVIKTIIMEQIE